MMQFQGRQTVRNMVVVTVLAAGAYFAAFYIPMLSSGTSSATEDREFGYLFHYRADQDMPGREEVLHLAEEMGVTVTRYAQQSGAVLAYDGYADVVSEGPLGTTYDVVYCEETASDVFLSESAWNILTGDDLDLEPGTAATVYDRNGDSSGAGNSISLVTNHLTGEQLAVTPAEPLRSTSLLGYRVLDDGDYARITQGLPDEWREVVAVFDVEDEEDTYFFARALFDEIVDRSGPEVASSTVGTRWSGTVIWQRRATTSWTRPIWNPMDFLPLNMTSGIPATSGIPGNTCPASGCWTRRTSPLPWRFF